MPIRVLAEEVASQIAAGEVVERPASVVKELVENALDAGATTINIEIEGSGRQLIRVADNGAGIPAAEVELAFARHATSKIQAVHDLTQVSTLGFRGEALASIASVSRTQVLTRARGENTGTQLKLEGGAVRSNRPLGAPQGTVVAVENLFFNVPARLKFLKSDSSERSHITRLVTRTALAYPAVRFRLQFDNRLVFQTNGTGNMADVLLEVFSLDISRQMIIVPATTSKHNITVGGVVSPPSLSRSNRREITLFVNGRWIQDARLNAAVTQAYHTLLMTGRYPIAVLKIDIPPEEVDVNVHPAKAELRFRNPNAAFSAVERAVRHTLLSEAPVPEFAPRQWQSGPAGAPGSPPAWTTPALLTPDSTPPPPAAPYIPDIDTIAAAPEPPESGQQPLPATDMPLMRVVGQVGAAYIVAEGPDGLYLIDQHAAHERVLFEVFREQAKEHQVASQALLQPVAVDVSPAAATQLHDQLDTLKSIGFDIEPFGPHTFMVRSLPAVLGNVDPARAVRVVVEDFEEDEAPLAAEVEARIIARVCKRAAVKAGQVLTQQEQIELVRRLEQCDNPRTCPHGRPTMIHLSVDMLERQFGRKGTV